MELLGKTFWQPKELFGKSCVLKEGLVSNFGEGLMVGKGLWVDLFPGFQFKGPYWGFGGKIGINFPSLINFLLNQGEKRATPRGKLPFGKLIF